MKKITILLLAHLTLELVARHDRNDDRLDRASDRKSLSGQKIMNGKITKSQNHRMAKWWNDFWWFTCLFDVCARFFDLKILDCFIAHSSQSFAFYAHSFNSSLALIENSVSQMANTFLFSRWNESKKIVRECKVTNRMTDFWAKNRSIGRKTIIKHKCKHLARMKRNRARTKTTQRFMGRIR